MRMRCIPIRLPRGKNDHPSRKNVTADGEFMQRHRCLAAMARWIAMYPEMKRIRETDRRQSPRTHSGNARGLSIYMRRPHDANCHRIGHSIRITRMFVLPSGDWPADCAPGRLRMMRGEVPAAKGRTLIMDVKFRAVKFQGYEVPGDSSWNTHAGCNRNRLSDCREKCIFKRTLTMAAEEVATPVNTGGLQRSGG
jgi:hypothetical protein